MHYTGRMSVDDEQELIKEIQKDSRKFGYLFDLYYKPVFGYIFCRIVLYDIPRDIAAETFLKAFLSVPDTGNIKPPDELKITLLSAKKQPLAFCKRHTDQFCI